MKKHLCILTAFEAEAKLLLKALGVADLNPVLVRGRQTFTCEDENFQWNIFVSGMGKIQAASACQMVIDLYESDRLYEFGLAGGLVDNIGLGDSVIVSDVCEYDAPNREDVLKLKTILKQKLFQRSRSDIARFAQYLTTDIPIQVVRGAIACGDRDIFSRAIRDRIAEQSRAIAVDWESEAIVEVCALNDISYVGVRIVADKAAEEDVGPIKADVWATLERVTRAYVQAVKCFEH